MEQEEETRQKGKRKIRGKENRHQAYDTMSGLNLYVPQEEICKPLINKKSYTLHTSIIG